MLGFLALTACNDDLVDIQLPYGALRCVAAADLSEGSEVNVFMRPESLSLSRKDITGRGWKGTVEFSIYHGDCWDYHVRLGEDLLKVRVYREKVGLEHGDLVFLEPDPDSAIVMPAATGMAAIPAEVPVTK